MVRDKGYIFSIQKCLGTRQAMKQLGKANLNKNIGMEGDHHARVGSQRQLLLVELEVLQLFDLDVAEIKENITTCGIALSKIVRGQRLKIGKVVQLSITKPCEPCSRLDEIRMGLQKELMGQRGMLATVVVGGMMSIGDPIDVLPVIEKGFVH